MTIGKMRVSKTNESAFVEDEKRPAKLIVTAKPSAKSGYFTVIILHPNRVADPDRPGHTINPKLYEQDHAAQDINQAMDIGNKIKDEQFFDVKTEHEEVKFIPNYKKGKMKLDTKEAADEEKAAKKAADKAEKAEAKETKKQANKIIKESSKKVEKKTSKKTKKTVDTKQAKKKSNKGRK